jgi:hypothetical protein
MHNTSIFCQKTRMRDLTSSTRMSKRTVSLMSRIHTTRFTLMSRQSLTCYRQCRTASTATQRNSMVNPLGFCCRARKIHLSTPETPPELMRLWSSSNADARHFRANIRYFNNHFSFTSLYYHLDRITTNMRICGVYTFCAHGQIYHNI